MSEVKCPFCGIGLPLDVADSWEDVFGRSALHLDSCAAAQSLPVHLRRAIAAGLAKGALGQNGIDEAPPPPPQMP
jgi:hypothetical protein